MSVMTVTAQVQAIDIMPLGDSITEGYGACSYRTPLVESFGNCNVTMVGSDTAPRAIPGDPPPANCITSNVNSEGHSGYATTDFMDTSPYGVSRVSYWLNLNTPDAVILHVGSNDMRILTSSTQFPGEYDPATNTGTGSIGRISEMVNAIYAENSNASVYVADLIPWYASSVVDARIDELRIELAFMVNDRASDGDDIQTVAVSPGYQPSMMQSDQIHPNTVGEKHMASRFAKALHDDNICKPTPQILSPLGSTLQGATQSFTWSIDNMDSAYVESWQVRAGSSANASDYAVVGGNGSSTQATLTGLPTSGETVYVTVRMQYFTGAWHTATRTYSAATIGGSTCNGQTVTVYIGSGDAPTPGNDVILGTAAADTIRGLGGNDTICGLAGNDDIFGGNGLDWIDGGPGDDFIRGGAHSDTIMGGSGNDRLVGNSGDDFIYGNVGVDVMFGGPGNDYLEGGADSDRIYGDNGNDTLRGGDGGDIMRGAAGDDTMYGEDGVDNMTGGSGDDFMDGGLANDTMFGNTGQDELYGDRQNDTLNGGPDGPDLCDGGTGTDSATGNCESTVDVP